MIINLPDRSIDVFTISPRTLDTDIYWRNIQETIALADKYNCTGNLIFTGNDIYVEAWLVAHELIKGSSRLSPLIAVNPLYMHPFTVAKMISSFGYLYKRKTYINFVTGTSKNDLVALNDHLTHDQRYERLIEYVNIVKALLSSNNPVNFNGLYYTINNLQLRPLLSSELFPEFYIAGASDPAIHAAGETAAVRMKMAYEEIDMHRDTIQPQMKEGIYMGIITRADTVAARERLLQLFPENEEGKEMLDFSMNNTDAVWKHALHESTADMKENNTGFTLKPFKRFQSDCPYYVGDYADIARMICAYVKSGVRSFILDIPCDEEEYRHINHAFDMAQSDLLMLYHSDRKAIPSFDFNF